MTGKRIKLIRKIKKNLEIRQPFAIWIDDDDDDDGKRFLDRKNFFSGFYILDLFFHSMKSIKLN